MLDPVEALARFRLLPLLTLRGGEDLEALGQALLEEGLPLLEVTLRTPEGLQALPRLAAQGLVVGAGTVRSQDQAAKALAAGAAFLVSPALVEEVAHLAQERQVPYFPGVLTPGEVERALGLGLRDLKFFPAKAFHAPQVLRAYAEVFPEARFIPTGGLREEDLPQYAPLPNLLACGGSWLLEGSPAEVRRRIRAAKALLTPQAPG